MRRAASSRGTQHDLDAITPSVAARVVLYDLLVRLPARDADRYSASSYSALGRSPSSAATGMVSDLSSRYVEPHQAAFRISDGVQLPVQTAFPTTDPSAAPLLCTQAASHALCLQRVASIMMVFGSAIRLQSRPRSRRSPCHSSIASNAYRASWQARISSAHRPSPTIALMKTMPLSTFRSSARGRPWPLRKMEQKRFLCVCQPEQPLMITSPHGV